jgi:hypothetical protein
VASLQQLSDDVMGYLNRRDIVGRIPSWVLMVETELAETLRARCMVTFGNQSVDAPYITLPANFAAMESIRDATTGELLTLKDEWSGSWVEAYMPSAWNFYQINTTTLPSTGYRILADCIEFLPHPIVPNPPSSTWVPQQVLMGWYQKPTPLVQPADTNVVLEQLYSIYLYGVCRQGAIFELDDNRASQMDNLWQQVITRANLWKQQSDYSGSPLVEEMAMRL